MKARRATNDTIVLFRPDKNAERFQAGADRLCMPQVPTEMFVSAVKELVQANSDYVSIKPIHVNCFWVCYYRF
jgi:branched-chain amino acid aminotransferase